MDFAPVQTETAEETYERVLDAAGATLPRRDAHDMRIVGEVRRKTTYGNGIIAGKQTWAAGPNCALRIHPSADADGMPDAWERPFTAAGDLS